MKRRDLIKNIASGSVTLMLAPAVLTSCTKEDPDPDINPNPGALTIDLTDEKYSSLLPDGGFYVENNIIIFNTGDGFLALSALCTHNACRVSYDHSEGQLPCPCHGSVFSSSGSVVKGPAETPLKKYDLSQDGDILSIVL